MNKSTAHKKRLFLKVFLILHAIFYLIGLPHGEATDRALVKDIRYWSSSGQTRVVIYLSQPVEFTKSRLSNPDRLFFDLSNSKISKEIKNSLPVGDGILKLVRAGQYNKDTVRVVLDLETMEDFNVFTLDDPSRLIIDVNAKRAERVVARKIVVLDPGHGGHDPGAVGQKGLREKDVVLDIALKVRKILSEDPSVEISLTRDKDVFIPLEERTAIAKKRDADLFVSVHANASTRRTARGIETYLLNWTTDEEAIRVAARENYISVKKMKESMQKHKDNLVDIMLGDLSRDFKRDESIKLANYVQNSLVTDAGTVQKKVANLGVKQALFYVLVGATMPSILAEVSFISNPEEERLLSSENYRAMLANSIASGIRTYLSSVPDQQKTAENKRAVSSKKRQVLRVSTRR